MITLNQIVKQFENIADAHKDINSFNFGDMWEIATSGTVRYPQLYVVPTASTVTGNNMDYNFNVLVMTRVSKGERGETDALSDMLQLMNDVLATLNYTYKNYFEVSQSVNMTPFTELEDDELTGWNASFTISVPFLWNSCAVPINTININLNKTLEQ